MKLTPQDIEEAIAAEHYQRVAGTTTTLCIMTLWNDFVVIGKSACMNQEDFDEFIGERIAREDAVRQIWQLEGYRLASEKARK